MKIQLAMLLLGCAILARGEFKTAPDANTLWIEDGVNLQTAGSPSDQGWLDKNLKLEAAADGGFTVSATDPAQSATGRYVPISAEYPYCVFEITKIKNTGKYTAVSLSFPGAASISVVANLQPGVYVWKPFELANSVPDKKDFLRFDVYGMTLDMPYIKMVKVPDVVVTAQAEDATVKKGGRVTFEVQLQGEVEDVCLKFFDSYRMFPVMFNGKDKLQLEPVAGKSGVWSASCVLNSIRPKKLHGKLFARAVILGSENHVPVWTQLPLSFDIQD